MMLNSKCCLFFLVLIVESYNKNIGKVLEPNGTLLEIVKPARLTKVIAVFHPEHEHTYYYCDGQSANFACRLSAGSHAMLSHISQDGVVDSSTGYQNTNSVNMYMKLTAYFNDTTLECVITDNQFKHKQIIRLRFIIKTDRKAIHTSFKVNDLILPSYKNTSLYDYFDGEHLSVSVVTDNQSYDNLTCEVYGTNTPPELYNRLERSNAVKSSEVIYFAIHKGQSVLLSCKYQQIVSLKQMTIDLVLTFYDPNVDNTHAGPFINGLSMSNILIKYSYSNESRITAIHYDIGNNVLQLDCSTTNHARPAKWVYNHNEVMATSVSDVGSLFQLTNTLNTARVTCQESSHIVNNRKIYLELYRRNHTQTSESTFTLAITNSTNGETQINEPNTPSSTHKEKNSEHNDGIGNLTAAIVGALVIGSVITVALIIITWRYCKNSPRMVTGQVSRRQSDNDDNTSPLYETIPELDVIEEPQSFIPGASSKMNISSRPPCPLPLKTNEDNPYLHYDTVYEKRVFKLGRNGPILHVCDRSRNT